MNHTLSNVPHASSAVHADTGLNPSLKAGQTWLARLSSTLTIWQNRTTQRAHLREIEDRLLADMGITRADAEHESRKPFWQA